MSNKTKSGKKRNYLIIIIPVLFIAFAIVYGIIFLMPNFESIPLYKFHEGFNTGKINIMIEDAFVESSTEPIIINDILYMPVDFIEEYISQYIFWDAPLSRLTITTETEVMRMRPSESEYYVNRVAKTLNQVIHEENGMAFMPQSLIEELYPVEISYSDVYNVAIISFTNMDRTFAEITEEKTNIRYEPDHKSPIAATLLAGEEVLLLDTTNTFSRVRTQDGVVAYVPTKDIKTTETIPAIEEEIIDVRIPRSYEGKLNLVWDMITVPQANASLANALHPKGLDVLSPTWFLFERESMEMISIAGKDYVDVAHAAGYQVWPRVIDYSRDISRAMASTDYREQIIDQLIEHVETYNLDGINMDFEYVPEDAAVYYLQFMRELAPLMRERDSVLSIAMFVPLYTRFYNRTEIEKTVDYVMVMAYDEHHGNSETSGPVASLDFVRTGILQTLEEVPREKVVLCIPFYVRIWREVMVDGELQLTIRNVGMNFAKSIFEEQGVIWEWQEDIGNYYGEYTIIEDGVEVTYKTWLEDLRSLEKRLDLMDEYGLVGVAGWSKGLENPEVWDLLYDRLK